MKKYEIYVGGEFIKTNNLINVVNSFDNSIVAQTYLAGSTELETAIIKAEMIKDELKNLPSFKKYDILSKISNKIREKKQYLAEILTQEACKPLKYALGEIERSIQTFTIAAEESKRLPKEYISLDWTPAGENNEGIIKYFPVGLVAGIAPFNFPLNLAVHKIAPAIASGCPIILKPSRNTPLSVLELAKIIDETDLPKGAISILPMDRNSGNKLVTDKRFGLLTFTGSPDVGWKMKNEAGKKKVVLELGGNAGVIITETANIKTAVKKCITGAFAYSGQVCIHAQRLYVNDLVFDEFIKRFIYETKLLKFGNPLDIETDISSMIDESNAVRIENWVKEAVSEGALVLLGGKRTGTFYEPTILTNTNSKMKVSCLEAFGPIVTIEKYSKFENAIFEINNSDYGLQAGIFTDKLSEVNYAFNNLNVGGVIINDAPIFRVDNMPYGGIKNSGLGREGVKYSIFEMLEPKLLVKKIL